MSSRNLRLSREERKSALVFYRALHFAKAEIKKGTDLKIIKDKVTEMCSQEPLVRLEYFELADTENLNLLESVKQTSQSILLVAGFVGEIRLIDNMFIEDWLMSMRIEVLKSKIHRVKITQAELHFVGSITIDEAIMEAANLIENEKVQVVNINNGERLETYVIKGQRNSGTICLNGPAARKAQVGDVVIIISYASMEVEEAKKFKPTLVFPDPDNKLA